MRACHPRRAAHCAAREGDPCVSVLRKTGTPGSPSPRFARPGRTVWLVAALLFASPTIAAPPSPCAYLAAQIDAAPSGPIFLASYPETSTRELKDAAFVYDNAVAVTALVGCNEIPRARRIGDALLFALDHDRFWHDGRLRNAYLAGAVTNPVKLPGWWDTQQNGWAEDRYQVGSDTGNLAWAMLALLALDRVTNDPRYRAGAARIGTWLRTLDNRGGTVGGEPKPDVLRWSSTEHNIDLAGAYTALAATTGDPRWRNDARKAASFVQSMWSDDGAYFQGGLREDDVTREPLLALDVQVWSLLAIPAARPHQQALLTTIERLARGGGYTYADGGQVMWTEGTAQAALLFALMGDGKKAAALSRTLRTMRDANGGYLAAPAPLGTNLSVEGDTAQMRYYYRTPHLAAAAWAALAERRFNPFTGTQALPR